MKVFSEQQVREKLVGLEGWELTAQGIQKSYKLDSFAAVMKLVNQVADFAEKANHHPDIFISYDKVTFTLMTHDAGGITQNDFDMAGRIQSVAP